VNKFQNIIPHLDVVIILSRSKSPTDVNLRATEWAIITQIDGAKTIGQIAKTLALTEDEALDMFYGLYQKGLIEIVSTDLKKDAVVPDSFFQRMQDELTKIIGPVAPFVLEEALWDVNAVKENFRTDRVPELVEILSDEISDNQKKIRFQQVMLELIKELGVN